MAASVLLAPLSVLPSTSLPATSSLAAPLIAWAAARIHLALEVQGNDVRYLLTMLRQYTAVPVLVLYMRLPYRCEEECAVIRPACASPTRRQSRSKRSKATRYVYASTSSREAARPRAVWTFSFGQT